MRARILSAVLFFIAASSITCFAQQDYVSRFDAFGGYSFLDTPSLNQLLNGFNGEFGVNVKTWIAIGVDYSIFTGSNNITTRMLKPALQQEVDAEVAMLQAGGILPANYQVAVPTNSTVWTFSGGPQFNLRKLKYVTFFIRPALGVLHETATLKPTDPFTTELVDTLVGPSMKKSDQATFYGVGGGMDFNFSDRWGLRFASDYVHYNVFSNILDGSRNTVRFSVGPTFRFGSNIAGK